MNDFIHVLVDLPLIVLVLLKITMVLGLGWIVHFFLIHRNPHWRVLLWRCVIVGLFLVPALLPLKYMQIRVASSRPLPTVSRPDSISGDSIEYGVTPVSNPLFAEPVPMQESAVRDESHYAPPSFSFSTWFRAHIGMIVFVVWAVVAAVLTSRLLIGFIRIRHYIDRSSPAPERFQRLLDRVAGDLHYPRKARLFFSPDFPTPFVTGFRKPVVIFPERMMSDKHTHESPAIMAHEVAHLCSGDLFWMLMTKWIGALLWFHPLVWKLQDAHHGACEEVCDAVAADYVGNAERYSSVLARIALEIQSTIPTVGVIPLVRSSDILTRLKILKRKVGSRPLAGRWVALSVLMGMAVFVCLGSVRLVGAEEKQSSFTAEKTLSVATQEEARQILKELQHRFQHRPPYQFSFLTEFELLRGARAGKSIHQGDKPFRYYKADGTIRCSGEKIEYLYTDAHLNDDLEFQKSTEYHSVWQDGRALELRKYKSGREEAVTTHVKLHDMIRPDSKGWFADGVFIGSNHFSESLVDAPELKIARETGIEGSELLRIEGEISSGTMTVWLSVDKPVTLKRASFKASSNFASHLDINSFNLDVEVLEYTTIGDAPFPTRAIATYAYDIPGKWKDVIRLTTTRREIRVNPDFEAMNAFQIVIPEGKIVEDYGANIAYKWVRGELQVIEGEPLPLKGKALPDFKDLGFDDSPAFIDGKVILVCFFDQGPPQNFPRRLKEQVPELKAKEVMFVFFFAPKMDGNTLSHWDDIPYPVGMIKGNKTQLRYIWGLKSLPWFILAGENHIVQAEGRSLSELNEALAKIDK